MEQLVKTLPKSGCRVAEFFAGAGLVRKAFEEANCRIVFANDISEKKRQIYGSNFSLSDFHCSDIRKIKGDNIPDVEIATASFPCTDLSVAGNRAGLAGEESGLVWEFHRVLKEMKNRRPTVVLLENVAGFATSRGGEDLRATISKLNELGYSCDLLMLDARHFVPQSRLRLFIIGSQVRLNSFEDEEISPVRPPWIWEFAKKHSELRLQSCHLPNLPSNSKSLKDIVVRFSPESYQWWNEERLEAFLKSLSLIQRNRAESMRSTKKTTWATAFRRTRNCRATWEIRADSLSGCLRTTKGGSSNQAIVEAGYEKFRVRWMTAREYARLQGAPDLSFGQATESQARFALGDAVCVPAVAWIVKNYLLRIFPMNDQHERIASCG